MAMSLSKETEERQHTDTIPTEFASAHASVETNSSNDVRLITKSHDLQSPQHGSNCRIDVVAIEVGFCTEVTYYVHV